MLSYPHKHLYTEDLVTQMKSDAEGTDVYKTLIIPHSGVEPQISMLRLFLTRR
jgi:hypothetical protein